MSTLELEHIKHSSSSGNNLSVHSDGSLTVPRLNKVLVQPQSGNQSQITTDLDDKILAITNNGNEASTGQAVIMWGKDNSSGYKGGIHYITDTSSSGSDGTHRFYQWNGSGWTNSQYIDEDGRWFDNKKVTAYIYSTNGSSSNFQTNGAHYVGHTSHFTGNNVNNDSTNSFSTSTGLFTCPVAGTYLLGGGVTPQNGSNTPRGYIEFRKNGSGIGPQQYYYNENYNGTGATVVVDCAVNDTLACVGVGTNSVSTSLYRGHFSIVRIG